LNKVKILVVRFSSIGDIVLTTPVVRCLKEQLAGCSVHYVTKAAFAPVLKANPHLDKVHVFNKDVDEIFGELRNEQFDVVIDLHHNLRSSMLIKQLGVNTHRFNKLNIHKYVAVNFKNKHVLPQVHIVDRYFETVKDLGVRPDGLGLDYFIPREEEIDVGARFFNGDRKKYAVLVPGGSYYTKRIPRVKLMEAARLAKIPLIMLGDAFDAVNAAPVAEAHAHVINACGHLSINQSASIVKQAEWVMTSDTGLMHIAAAFGKKIFSVWGNTIPEFGMEPYKPAAENRIIQNNSINCRPCTKLGYDACPLGHFRCMLETDYSFLNDL
jgi:ADP-heptose:LPS heptosyltransferase